jgi:uncharacterized protein YdeI (YjbR/CyaY-like superfamily)
MKALRAEKAEGSFNSLSAGKQNFIVRRINDAAKPQTREKRIQEALEIARGVANNGLQRTIS